MTRKPNEWPDRNELVIGTVVRVNPYSAFITLEEYGNKEGMVHISEVARKWIKDIREFVKEGQKVVALVMNVDKEKNHIALSMKRISKHESEERMKEFKREQKAEKMLTSVAKELSMSLDEVYKKIGFKLQTEFGEIFKAFQTSLTPQGYDLLIKKGIPENWLRVIKNVAEKQMEVKEVKIKGFIELKCPTPDGIEKIKKILVDSQNKYGIEIKYISAPKYTISIKSKDAKASERKLKEIADSMIKGIEACGGEGSFKLG